MTVIALVVAIVGYLFWSKEEATNSTQHQNMILKLLPFPMIIAADGSKDESPLNILLHKSNKKINFLDGKLEFDNIPPLGKKMTFDNVSIHFSYDEKENKVKFYGGMLDTIHSKISGEYYLDDQQKIVYNLNFISDLCNFILSGNYDYLNAQQGNLSGSFSLNMQDMIKLADYASVHSLQKIGLNTNQNLALSINGDYRIDESSLKIDNASLKSAWLDSAFDLDFKNEAQLEFSSAIKVNILDLDGVVFDYDIAKIYNNILRIKLSNLVNDLLLSYNQNSSFTTSLEIARIKYHNDQISNFLATITSDNNVIKVSNLDFILPGNNQLSSSGTLTTNKIRPIYNGNFAIDCKNFDRLMSYLFPQNNMLELKGNTAFVANGNIQISPSLNLINNVSIVTKQGSITGDLVDTNYRSHDIIHTNLNLNNLTIDLSEILKQNPFTDLVKKSNQEDFTDRVMRLKTLESVHDVDVKCSNVIFNNNQVQYANAEFIVGTNKLELNGIKVKTDNLKFDGKVNVDTSGVTPFLNIGLEGDTFDPKFVKYLTYVKQDLSRDENSDSNSTIDNTLKVFRFDKFIGYIQLNFKNLRNKYFSATDFNFFASLKDNLMVIEKMNARLFDGDFALTGNVGFVPPSTNVSFRLNKAAASKFVNNLFQNDNFIGDVDMEGNLYGFGLTGQDIEKQLSGKIKVASENLIIDHFNINSFIASYGKSVYSSKGKKIGLQNGSTTLNNLAGEIVVSNGIFESDKVEFETNEAVNGMTSFVFDLPTKKMNSITSFAYIDPEGKIDGFNISLLGPINNLKMQLGSGGQ